MSLPILVDIAIGLVFIYLLLSLLAAEIQELIATILQWRAKHLKDSITNLFAGDAHSHHSVAKAHQLTRQVYQHPLVRSVNQESRGFLPNLFRSVTWLISRFYRWVIRKDEGEFGDRLTAPSYIPREAFATAFLEQLGAKYFVERLVEAKFSDFVAFLLDRVKSFEGVGENENYQNLERSLTEIEQEFIQNNIDLNSALQSIMAKLDAFLNELREIPQPPEGLEQLQDWRNLIFPGDQLERTIKNAGLKPTLQEIVDSIDKNSKTFRTYKERFHRYEQERFHDVRHDLRKFNKFLLVFLQCILGETPSLQNSPPQAAMVDSPRVAGLNRLDDLFFLPVSEQYQPEETEINRTKTPISQLEPVILHRLKLVEKKLNPRTERNRNLNLRRRIHAFREGFAGKNYVSDLLHYLLYRESIFSKIVPFCLLVFLGFSLAVILSGTQLPGFIPGDSDEILSGWQRRLIGPRGSLWTLAFLALAPLLCFLLSRWWYRNWRWRWFDRRRHQHHNQDPEAVDTEPEDSADKRLPEIFDDYVADEIAAETETAATDSRERELSRAIAIRLAHLASTRSDSLLFEEIKDLGRSFRRHYLRLILENADVDLPFIPNSVKQSLAVLIRRSKTSAKQAENQVIHLKAEVEAWYDRSMERASGVYRRNAKGVSILIGIFLAIAVNANSIHILDQLAFEEELRLTLADSASQALVNAIGQEMNGAAGDDGAGDRALNVEETAQLLDKLREEISPTLDELNLPIGWDPYLIDAEFECNMPRPDDREETIPAEEPQSTTTALFANGEQGAADSADETKDFDRWHHLIRACLYSDSVAQAEPVTDSAQNRPDGYELRPITGAPPEENQEDGEPPPESFFYPTAIASIFLQRPLIGLRYLLGWIITGIAIAMGASFWFDLLGKLVKVRNTGNPISTVSEMVDSQDDSKTAPDSEE